MRGGAVAGGRTGPVAAGVRVYVFRTGPVAAGVRVYNSVSHL